MESLSPYRSVEVTRVVECEACERSRTNAEELRKKRAERIVAIGRGTKRGLAIGPWMAGLFYLDGRMFAFGDSYGFIQAMLIIATLIALTLSVRYVGWGSLRD